MNGPSTTPPSIRQFVRGHAGLLRVVLRRIDESEPFGPGAPA